MKRMKDKIIISQREETKKNLLKRFEIDEKFVDMIYDELEKKYSEIICANYSLNSLYDNPILAYKIYLSICLNHEFDKDRYETIEYSKEYIENFTSRIVAQTIYSDLSSSIFQVSSVMNHPTILILHSISSLIKYRSTFTDLQKFRRTKHADYLPILRLIIEAMTSLESVLTLIAEKAFSQAMTIYRLYLEQVIIAISIVKNPHLIDRYLAHQKLAEKYADDTADEDISKILEGKNIPARDIKSYLSYGWIEGLEGFSELPKPRYSIKVMAKLAGISDIYELYASATNYVHMNYLYSGIDWIKVINNTVETLYATLIGIMERYKEFTNYNFIYKNIDLFSELMTIFTELEKVLSNSKDECDVLRLKTLY